MPDPARLLPLGAALAAVALLGGCATPQVRSDVNAALAGQVHCHSYDWAGGFRGDSPLRSTVANPLNESRLRAAISRNLESRGVHAVKENAECLVGYGIGARTIVEGAWPDYWGWGWGWPGWGPPYVWHEGIVGIDLYDAHSKQPIWHATVDQSLSGLTGRDAEERIEAAVAALFTHFPG